MLLTEATPYHVFIHTWLTTISQHNLQCGAACSNYRSLLRKETCKCGNVSQRVKILTCNVVQRVQTTGLFCEKRPAMCGNAWQRVRYAQVCAVVVWDIAHWASCHVRSSHPGIRSKSNRKKWTHSKDNSIYQLNFYFR